MCRKGWFGRGGRVGEPDFVVLLNMEVAFERVGKGCVAVVQIAEIRAVNGLAREDAGRNGG